MATPIIPRLFRDRLYCQTADVLVPTSVHAASAWADAHGHRVDTPQSSEQQTRQPLRRCEDCELDLSRDVLRALGTCPRWGKPRAGVESRCPAFVAKPGSAAQGGAL